MSEHMVTGKEAVKLYYERCQQHQCNPNNTYVKFLLSGTVIFEFDNSYLGENGIVPIMESLQRVPLHILLIPMCNLSADDIKLICSTFTFHPTLERIDLSGNSISQISARRLLQLVSANRHITELNLDLETPKYVAIQRQCLHNRNSDLLIEYCVACQKPMYYETDSRTETNLLHMLLDHYKIVDDALSAVEVESLFGLARTCCAHGNGVLFVCSQSCLESLVRDMVACTRNVIRVAHLREGQNDVTWPRNAMLRERTEALITELSTRNLPDSSFIVSSTSTTAVVPTTDENKTGNVNGVPPLQGTLQHAETAPVGQTERGTRLGSVLTVADTTAECPPNQLARIGAYANEPASLTCSVCGQCVNPATAPVVSVLLMQQLRKDLNNSKVSLGPSGFLRLINHLWARAHAVMCSRKCVRHLLRFALFGYGGALRANPDCVPLISSFLDVRTFVLADNDFLLVDIRAEAIDQLLDEDTTCALTVASAMSDIEGVRIDPYMIFALGRHLCQQDERTLGMTLHSACEVVRVVGCLDADTAPFQRQGASEVRDLPPRHAYSVWTRWGESTDVKQLLRLSLSRRRTAFYVVDGKFGNVFDNVRAALWRFRQQRRCALVCLKFSLEWLSVKDGILFDKCLCPGGFYTTAKVVGQTEMSHTVYLILQCNFGVSAGNKGFFYVPKTIFNARVEGNAYMFVDAAAYLTSAPGRGIPAQLQNAATPIEVEFMKRLFISFFLLAKGDVFSTAAKARLRYLLSRAPTTTLAVLSTMAQPRWALSNESWLDKNAPLFDGHGCVASLQFFFSERVGAAQRHWTHDLHAIGSTNDLASFAQEILLSSSLSAQRLGRSVAPEQLEWKVMDPNTVVTEVAVPEPTFPPVGGLESRAASSVSNSARFRSKSGAASVEKRDRAAERRKAEKLRYGSRDQTYAAYLGHMWSIERARMTGATLTGARGGRGGSRQLPAMVSEVLEAEEMGGFRPGFARGAFDEKVPLPHIGQKVQGIHFTNEDGTLTNYFAFFLMDSLQLYDVVKRQTVGGILRNADFKGSYYIPFANGFDCLFHNPLNLRESFAFAGTQWATFDTFRCEVTRGPFSISVHPQFNKLPVEFHHLLEAALPLVGTPFVFLFTERCYVLFDIEKCVPLSPVLKTSRTEEAVMNDLVSRMERADAAMPSPSAISGPRTAAGDTTGTVNYAAIPELPRQVLDYFRNPWSFLMFDKPSEVVTTTEDAGNADNTGSKTPAARNTTHSCVVCDSAGKSMLLELSSTPSVRVLSTDRDECYNARYSQLPISFRQHSIAALPAVAQSIVNSHLGSTLKVSQLQSLTLFKTRPTPSMYMDLYSAHSSASPYCVRTTLSPVWSGGRAESAGAATTSTGSPGEDGTDNENLLLRFFEPEPLSTQRPDNPLTDEVVFRYGESGRGRGRRGQGNNSYASRASSKSARSFRNASTTADAAPEEVQTDADGMDYIELDLGPDASESFGALVLVLDTSAFHSMVLQSAPLSFYVWSSANGISYEKHTFFVAQAPVTFTTWDPCPAARCWRLSIPSTTPVGIGFVRLMWYTAEWVPLSQPLRILQHLRVEEFKSCTVDVYSHEVCTDPQLLTAEKNFEPVFRTLPPGKQVYPRHCVLPLIRQQSSALLFLDGIAVEYDLEHLSVAARRRITLRRHPAFSQLPSMFLHGFDSAFYPDVDMHPTVVFLVVNGVMLPWDLSTGTMPSTNDFDPVPASGKVTYPCPCTKSLFPDFPFPIDGHTVICNAWDTAIDEVLVIAYPVGSSGTAEEAQVVRWSLSQRTLIKGPDPLRANVNLFHPDMQGKTLMTMFSLLQAPHDMYIFADDQVLFPATAHSTVNFSRPFTSARSVVSVATSSTSVSGDAPGTRRPSAAPRTAPTARAGGSTSAPDGLQRPARQLVPFAFNSVFHNASILLPIWGKPTTSTTVIVDFGVRTSIHCITGVEMHCLEEEDCEWVVECAKSSNNFEQVAIHHHRGTTSHTCWSFAGAEYGFYRYWRLTTTARTDRAYRKLVFLTFPIDFPLRSLPARISCSPDLLVSDETDCSTVVINSSPCVADGNSAPAAVAVAAALDEVRYMLFDFGTTPCAVVGLAVEGAAGTSEFSILFSNSGTNWTSCGQWAMNTADFAVSWPPRGAWRYWKIVLHSGSHNNGEQSGFRLQFATYTGPSLVFQHEDVSVLSHTDVMFANDDSGSARFFTAIDNAIVIHSAPQEPLSMSGLDMTCLQSTSANVVFDIECSGDARHWVRVGSVTYDVAHPTVSMNWGVVGSYLHWRLRVVGSSNPNGFVTVRHLFLVTTKDTVYTTYTGHPRAAPLLPEPLPSSILTNTGNTTTSLTPAATSGASTTGCGGSVLRLTEPASLCKVRATLPPNSVYAVQRLGLDGWTWETVNTITNANLQTSQVCTCSWTSQTPSREWRLWYVDSHLSSPFDDPGASLTPGASLSTPPSPSTGALSNGNRPAFLASSASSPQHLTRAIESQWFMLSTPNATPVMLTDNATISTENFLEVEPVRFLATSNIANRIILRSNAGANGTPNNSNAASTPSAAAQKSVAGASSSSGNGASGCGTVSEHPSVYYTFKTPVVLHAVLVTSRNRSKSIAGAGAAARAASIHLEVACSDNGRDFRLLASTRCDRHPSVLSSWVAPEAAVYWRISFVLRGDGKAAESGAGTLATSTSSSSSPGAATTPNIDVYSIKWYTTRGREPLGDPQCISTSNVLYAAWMTDAEEVEQQFMEWCRSGLEQAKSKKNKLRGARDVAREGEIAECVLKMRNKYQAFISKLAKGNEESEAASAVASVKMLSHITSDNLRRDIIYFLLVSHETYQCGFNELAHLIAQPLSFAEDTVSYTKKDTNWFYPSFEMMGVAAGTVFGFSACPVSFTVLWSLSTNLQRNLDHVMEGAINEVSPHVASPLVTVSICGQQEWLIAEHFPDVPFLYHCGFGGSDMAVVFALNEISFNEQYNLQVPKSKPFPARFPFKVFSGVNFVRHGPLASCPAPIFEFLQMLYSPEFLRDTPTVMVLTAPSVHCHSATLRFTLPADTVNFGIKTFRVASLEFEVTIQEASTAGGWTAGGGHGESFSAGMPPPSAAGAAPSVGFPTSPGLVDSGAGDALAGFGSASGAQRKRRSLMLVDESAKTPLGECTYSMSFITHGATLENGKVPFRFIGSFSLGASRHITLKGFNRGHRLTPSFVPTPGFLCNLGLSGKVYPGNTPQQFRTPDLTLEAHLVLSQEHMYRCRYQLTSDCCLDTMRGSASFLFSNAPLYSFVSFWQVFLSRETGAEPPVLLVQDRLWFSSVPLRLFIVVELSLAELVIRGSGKMGFYGSSVRNLQVYADKNGFRLVGCAPELQLGNAHYQAGTTDLVSVEVLCQNTKYTSPIKKVSENLVIRIRGGMKRPKTDNFFNTVVELTESGLLAIGKGDIISFSGSSPTYFPKIDTVQVALDHDTLRAALRRSLIDVPMISALISNGLSFTFSLHDLITEPFMERFDRLVVTVRGVLMGTWFEANTCINVSKKPNRTLLQILCDHLALLIVEQTQDTLWASFGHLVGFSRERSEGHAFPADTPPEDLELLELHHVVNEGSFLNEWDARELRFLEKDIDDYFL